MSDETLEEVRARLIDAMALPPEEHADWLRHAEHNLYAHRAMQMPWMRQYDVSTVGGRIRTARVVLGMSQQQLSIRMGVTQYDVSGWERGTRNLRADLLPRLCAVCGVTKDWILGLSREGGPPIPEGQQRRKVTRAWRQKRDYENAIKRAQTEAKKLNAAYQRRKER